MILITSRYDTCTLNPEWNQCVQSNIGRHRLITESFRPHKPKVFFGNTAFLICYITASTKKTHYKETGVHLNICRAYYLPSLISHHNSIRVGALGKAAAVPLCLGTDSCRGFQAFSKWFSALNHKHRLHYTSGAKEEVLNIDFLLCAARQESCKRSKFFITRMSAGCNCLWLFSRLVQSSAISKRKFTRHFHRILMGQLEHSRTRLTKQQRCFFRLNTD